MSKYLRILIAALAVVIGFYPALYLMVEGKIGLLASKADEVVFNSIWRAFFYGHIIPGGIALLTGWIQFSRKFRVRRLNTHKRIGQLYLVSVAISSVCGMYLALFATGGTIATVGFASLAILWFTSALFGFFTIKNGLLLQHQKWMTRNYALTFAAVTLRIWLGLAMAINMDFFLAYRTIAWMCWVPNLLFAEYLCFRLNRVLSV